MSTYAVILSKNTSGLASEVGMGSRVAGTGLIFMLVLSTERLALMVPVLGRTRGGLYRWMGGTFGGKAEGGAWGRLSLPTRGRGTS